MARRQKAKLRLVKGKPKPPKPPRCKAKTKAGKRCARRAKKNGACGLKAHQDQVRGVKAGTFDRREPAKHEAKCKACKSPARERVEAEWTAGGLSDAEAAQMLNCKTRAWQRHAAYKKLYVERANHGALPYLMKIMEKALLGDPKLGAGVTAASLAHKIAQGGERIFIEAINTLRDQERGVLFEALDRISKVKGELTAEQFIEIFHATLKGDGEDGRVH